jgi:hypothetical protein
LCSSGEAIDDWQGWTGMFLLDPIAMLFVCCLMMLSVAKVIEHMYNNTETNTEVLREKPV